ncbi:MAG: hypothetical protein K0R98_1119 [Rickettsiaceae bacterium]|jgi:hypothetical protein|nr:hypothetical protein [Rickettsiaceae bacterium]
MKDFDNTIKAADNIIAYSRPYAASKIEKIAIKQSKEYNTSKKETIQEFTASADSRFIDNLYLVSCAIYDLNSGGFGELGLIKKCKKALTAAKKPELFNASPLDKNNQQVRAKQCSDLTEYVIKELNLSTVSAKQRHDIESRIADSYKGKPIPTKELLEMEDEIQLRNSKIGRSNESLVTAHGERGFLLDFNAVKAEIAKSYIKEVSFEDSVQISEKSYSEKENSKKDNDKPKEKPELKRTVSRIDIMPKGSFVSRSAHKNNGHTIS